jgi:CHAD domain-containing protein
MAEGKWIADLKPDKPLLEAARHVLFVRLQAVRDYLPRVVHQAHEDPEHVHQLRVATRRADAALRTFRSCLPDRAYRAARDRLRVVRRAAGTVRDLDVFLLELGGRLPRLASKSRPGYDFLAGYGLGQRNLDLGRLQEICREQAQDFEAYITEVVTVLRPSDLLADGSTLVDLARPMLSHLRERLERAAAGDLTDYPQLHQVRIAGKRLRYAMEIFADCFPQTFREGLYPLVEQMQEILGRANDSHVAVQRLEQLRHCVRPRWPDQWKRLQPGLDNLLRFHQRRLPQERRRFVQWWDRWRARASEELLTTLVVGVMD